MFWVPLLNACCCVVAGCDWTTASVFSVLARTALLSPLLPRGRHRRTTIPVDSAQEVQDQFPQVRQLPDHLCRREQHASGDAP